MKTKKIAFLGVLTALSSIAFLIESFFPPLFVPGARLGLGNIFILIALVYLGFFPTLVMVIAKCLIVAIFSGASALLYSLPAGLCSLILSFILIKRAKNFSLVAVGSASAVVHNLVQNIMFAFITMTANVMLYAPYLAFLGMLCGCLTGISACLIIKYADQFINKKILSQI